MLKKFTAAGVVAAAASGVLLLGAPANADTRGDDSILGGNVVAAPISIPINVCGNSVAVIGIAGSDCKGGAQVVGGHHPRHHWGY